MDDDVSHGALQDGANKTARNGPLTTVAKGLLGLANRLADKVSPPVAGVVLLVVVVLLFALALVAQRQGAGILNTLLSFLYVALAIIGALVLAPMLVRAATPAAGASSTAAAPIKRTWTRLVPRQPIPSDKLDELADDLEDIRNAAFSWLSQKCSGLGLKPTDIRANVFLPDYVQAEDGDVCMLFMPPKLRANMQGHPDEDLRFRPRQGLTGRVFIRQKASLAKTSETEPGEQEFDELYELTDEQKRALHPQLRWIVSIPLMIPDETRPKAAGVLNVDGLRHDVAEDDLNALSGAILKKVGAFADKVAALPSVRVLIGTVEV